LGRLRRAATFVRKIGVEISFRARTTITHPDLNHPWFYRGKTGFRHILSALLVSLWPRHLEPIR
jgi:hypothetical protein